MVSAGVAPWSAGRSGLSCPTFHADDWGPVAEALPTAGARPLPVPAVVLARGRRIGFWSDPEGSVVELADACDGDPARGIVIRDAVQ